MSEGPHHASWGMVTRHLAVVERWDDHDQAAIAEIIKEAKEQEVAHRNESAAKTVWCYEAAFFIQNNYFRAFQQLKQGQYYAAWCSLERAEVQYGFLSRHMRAISTETHVETIFEAIKRFQLLYPYRVFLSPEFRKKVKKCSICDSVIRIRSPCGHQVGEIYGGELCLRHVVKADVVGLALVDRPVQKYSVTFLGAEPQGADHYDYSLVKYAVERLDHPFMPWSVERTSKRWPHTYFEGMPVGDLCPCGGGQRYGDCCLQSDGVLLPHWQFIFPSHSDQLDEEILFLPRARGESQDKTPY